MTRTVAIALLLMSSPVSAATVHLGLISRQCKVGDPVGEWELWAWTSSGDNDGLHGYAVELFGDDVEGDHTSPLRLVSEHRTGGFVVPRIPIPDLAVGNVLFAFQIVTPGTGGGSLRGVGSPDVPARINPPDLLSYEILNQEWWLNPAFVSSSMLGDNPFKIPQGAVQLGVGTTGDYRSLEIFDTSSTSTVYPIGGFFFETELADTAVLVDHVQAVPEPSARFIGLAVLTCILVRVNLRVLS